MRYQLLERLGVGGMGEVHLAYDRLTGDTVALKRVLVDPGLLLFKTQSSTASMKIALANEFKALAGLRHPNIVSVIDYGFDDDQTPYFTMEYLANTQNITNAGLHLDTGGRVDLLIQMMQGLHYLHRRGLLHRDLKHGNVMVVDETVKIIDFGLAVEGEHVSGPAGTVTYMAPEIFTGELASPASDLYAAGLIAYGMFARRFAFDINQSTKDLINDILHKPVDCSMLPENARPIVERLLQKRPEDRYQTAHDVILALYDATDQAPSPESVTIRESFLQSARFVGRDREMKQLTDALENALDGYGSAWLVGGESGVGKSRLLDELRTRAMVSGAFVLRGQSISGTGMDYQLWREPLRHLLLESGVSDLEAGVLKALVPDIEHLLERPVAPPPPIDHDAHKQRLASTIVDLIKRLSKPVVLLLEDLQWATHGLDILRQLTAIASELPILIVGSFRTEDKPTLPRELPATTVIMLERLDRAALKTLSGSMLGAVGYRDDLVDFLGKETEGNAYFMIEVIRVLAEESGSLDRIGDITLPEVVLSGSIQAIMQRRLERVPLWVMEGLKLAAVAGRKIDKRMIAPYLQYPVEQWLIACADAAILTVQEDQWRFEHDKLRQHILFSLADDERAALHETVATTIEDIYPDGVTYANRLVEHWLTAGSPERAARYAYDAARQLVLMGDISTAVDYFETALAYDDGYRRSDILLELAEAHRRNGDYRLAIARLETVVEDGDNHARALAWSGIAWAQQNLGDDRASLTSAGEAISLLHNQPDADKVALAGALYHQGWAYFRLGDMESATAIAKEGLAVSEAAEVLQEKAHHLNLLSMIEGYMQGRYNDARRHQEQALKIHRELGDRHGEGIMLNNLGEIYRLTGDYEHAIELYGQALHIARSIGDQDGELAYLSNLGGAYVGSGAFDEAVEALTIVINRAPADFYVLPDTFVFLAEAYIGQHSFDNAANHALKVLKMENATPESKGHAWRILGRVASYTDGIMEVEKTPFDAAQCFAESAALFEEAGLERDKALAHWDWARHELHCGNVAAGKRLLREARITFVALDLPRFIDRMDAESTIK